MSTVLETPPPRRIRPSRGDGRLPPTLPSTGGDDGRDGDPSPRRIGLDNAILATVFLIAAEVMFFAGLVSAFWVLRLGAPVWPPPLQPRLPVGITGVNTLVLLGSSVAVVAAMRMFRDSRRRAAVRRLQLAGTLGGLFLVVQGYEWLRLIGFGLTMSSSTYGAAFYTLIGAHGVHVLAALSWLSVTLLLLARGRFADEHMAGVRACALYWHFVVALWPILYVSVYLS
ncbi:MAG TPA: cytochrome c oxidase subunit 3 [Methylomirabilota bacterium]|nr:cytochrome c oxidase subunit 3 [Methylomirabilota bacterium]